MKEEAGSHICFTGSAVHLDRAPTDGGRGFVKSRAANQLHAWSKGLPDLLTVSRSGYPHMDRIVSHISQVEHGSPLAGAGAMPLRALIILLAADTALAPLIFRIPFGARFGAV
jgi:hypothetical protein